MTVIFSTIPPFATDYSAAASTLSDMGGLVVIHGPGGCAGSFISYDEPRCFSSPKAVFSSLMREEETVFGDDDVLKRKILSAIGPATPFIAIVGTPVTDMIGCDLEGIATEIENETGIPAVGVYTTGYNYYDKGIIRTMDALAKRFIRKKAKREKTVNILGYNRYDFLEPFEIGAIRNFIKAQGYEVTYFQSDDDLEKFIDSPSAEKNIVLSTSSIPFAKRMKEQFGTPYSTFVPSRKMGCKNLKNFLKEDNYQHVPGNSKKDILVIHDQVSANTIRDILRSRFSMDADVASFFVMEDELSENGDTHLERESELKVLMKKYGTVIGDPLYNAFSPKGQKFIPVPHSAVSSRLHWQRYRSLTEDSFEEFLAKQL